MIQYILRKEPNCYLLYSLEANEIYISDNTDVEDVYNPSNFVSLSREAPLKLNDTFFLNKMGRTININVNNCEISAPTTIFFEVTKGCNLKCRHCFNDSGDKDPEQLSFSEICSLIDELARIGLFTIKVTGGEPFVRNDILDILDYLELKCINFILYTNGTCIKKTTSPNFLCINVC